MRNEKIDVVYSSDLQRCVDTANAIMKYHPDLDINFDKRLRERSFGDFEEKPLPKDFDWFNPPDSFESIHDIMKRTKEFFSDIFPKHKNKNVLIICHGGIKRAFLMIMNHEPDEEYNNFIDTDNTSITEFDVREDKNHKMITFNCTKHLGN